MPKKAMKTSSSWRSCIPKKGKQRMVLKVLGLQKKKNLKNAKVKYTRFGQVVQKSRLDRATWKRDIKELIKATDAQIVRMLIADSKCCQKRVLPHHGHPIFSAGRGQDYVPLQDQAAILLCAVSNIKQSATRLLLKRNHKFNENLYLRLDAVRAQFVEKKQAKIKFGATDPWPAPDVAVDWEQWGGVVERGRPETLVLTRLNPKKTSKRAPGPGPMRRTDWEPFACRRLQNKNVILHTDGARAYRLRLPGVLHDNVVHMKKKMKVNGVWVWIKPAFTKVVEHILPDTKKKLRAKAGTQVIDRLWRHVRSFLEGRTALVGSKTLRQRIRSAQWAYWYRGQDLWLQTGVTLQSMLG